MEHTLSSYLRSAKDVLEKFGVKEARQSKLVTLLDRVADVDETKVLAIAQTIQYMDDFNALVRNNVGQMTFSDRYNSINEAFGSIREDSERLVQQIEDGKISLWEKVSNTIRFFLKGTPHDRFLGAMETFYEVCDDLETQLKKETEISEAYQDFRTAFKEAEVLAFEVFETQKQRMTSAQDAFKQAVDAVTNYTGSSNSERSKLELARDKAERAYKAEEKKQDLLKFVAEELKQSYHTSKTIVEKLEQTHEVKDSVYMRAVSFVDTNSIVFTMMDAAYASLFGLHEGSKSLKALKEGANEGLKQLARMTKVDKEAIEQAYGVTIEASSVKELTDAMEQFLIESRKTIEEQKQLSTNNADEIERICNESYDRRQKIAYSFLEEQAPVEMLNPQ